MNNGQNEDKVIKSDDDVDDDDNSDDEVVGVWSEILDDIGM